jgi:filamentous hemagglutinin family protein
MLALPQGGTVIEGGAAITNPSAGLLQINQDTQRAIIDWNSFSIANGELAQFFQPGTNASTLNRVTGGNLSEIYGQLKANGNIYLVNPSGILIGSSGVIDVNSFIASTLDVNNGAFMAGGDMIFSGTSDKSIENMGTINAVGGDVFLIARSINNSGSINAPKGTVGLAAGKPADGEKLEVLLKASGSQRIFIRTKKIKETAAVEDKETVASDDTEIVEGDGASVADSNGSVTVPVDDNILTEADTGPAIDGAVVEETTVANGDEGTLETVTEKKAPTVDVKTFEAAEPEYEFIWEPVALDYYVGSIDNPPLTESELEKQNAEALVVSETSVTEEIAEQASIINTGIINAVQAELKSVGGNEYALAINNEGEIRATGVESRDGVVYLTAKNGDVENSGTIAASNANGDGGVVKVQAVTGAATNTGTIDVSSSVIGGKGGSVEVLGEYVNLSGNSFVNADGDSGGGQVLIGGDKLGENPEVQNAINTFFGETARITADATRAGDGGKVIVYADGTTDFLGSITARGGVESGNGGLIESSGKEMIRINPTAIPDARARSESGLAGEWLIDPFSLEIFGTGSPSGFTNPTTYEYVGNGSAYMDIVTLQSALNAGTSVNLTTSAGDGILKWNSNAILDYNGFAKGVNLSLNASGDLYFLGKIFDSTPGGETINVNFVAGGAIHFDGSGSNLAVINTGGGGVHLTAGTDILMTGNGSSQGVINTSGGGILLEAGRKVLATSVNMNSAGGSVNVKGNAQSLTTGDFKGVELNATTINSGSGSISLVGHAGNGSIGNYGVYIHTGSNVQTTTGGITINGRGGNNTTGSNAYGIKMFGSGTTVQSASGSINLNGFGGFSSTGSDNAGIYLGGSAQVKTTAGVAASTRIHLNGTGGAGASGGNHGIFLDGSGKVASVDGGIILNAIAGGTGTNASYGILLDSGGLAESTGNTPITLVSLANGTDAGIKIGNTSSVGGGSNSGGIHFFSDTPILDLSGSPIADITASSQIVTTGPKTLASYASFNPPAPIPPSGDGTLLPPPPPGDNFTIDPVTGTISRTDPLTGFVTTVDPLTGAIITTDPLTGEIIKTGTIDFAGDIIRTGLLSDGQEGELVRSILDDPNLTDEEKQRLLRELAGGGNSDDFDLRDPTTYYRPPVFNDGQNVPLPRAPDIRPEIGSDGEPIQPNRNRPAAEGRGPREGGVDGDRGPEPNEDREGAKPEGERGSEGERRGPRPENRPEPVNGTDTRFDDQVMLPGEVISFGGPVTIPPPPTLNVATSPVVRNNLGNTNAVTANITPPAATPVPPPVPPAPPALDIMRALPGQSLGMSFGGPTITPPPQVQATLDFSTGPSVANSLRAAMGN